MSSVQQLVQAVQAAASENTTAEGRRQAIAVWKLNSLIFQTMCKTMVSLLCAWRLQIVEEAKSGDAHTCVQAFFLLFQSADTGAQLNGLTLLRHVLRNHWEVLQAEQQQQLLQFITAATVDPNVHARAQPIRMQLAYSTCDLLILCGDEATEHFLSTAIVQMLQQGLFLSQPYPYPMLV